jgi:hypothetical protein
MSTAQLRCDTGISPFWIHPPVGCRPRCLIGFYFPLAALPGPCWPADHPKTKLVFLIRHVCTYRLHSPRCALITHIRPAEHSSPTSVTPCTHRLHSPPWRCALIAFIRHDVHPSLSCIRHAVHCLPSSSLSFVTMLCTHRFQSFATRAVHSSHPFARPCAHRRRHSPRCALTPLEWAYCPYLIPAVFIVYNTHTPYHKRGLMARAFLFFGGQVHNLLLIPTWVQVPSRAPSFWTDFWLFAFSPRATRPAVHSSLPFGMLCTHRLHSPGCALIAVAIRRDVHSLPWSGLIAHILSRRCL